MKFLIKYFIKNKMESCITSSIKWGVLSGGGLFVSLISFEYLSGLIHSKDTIIMHASICSMVGVVVAGGRFWEQITGDSVFSKINVDNYHKFLKTQPIAYQSHTTFNNTHETKYKYSLSHYTDSDSE